LPRDEQQCSNGSFSGASWSCKSHECKIEYCEKTTSTGAASDTCESASDCTGLLPQSSELCQDGTSQSAQWDCKKKACVISYCSDDGGPATSGGGSSSTGGNGTCQSATDCTGLLPRSVQQCEDGTSQPAQWDCESNACVISYCDSDGGLATSGGSGSGSASGNGSCQSASDCTGFLPQSSELCQDGTSQSAQWDCESNACVISYCDNDGGSASGNGG
jgi:hypothetical protein